MVVAGTAASDEFFIFNDNDGRQYLYGAGLKMENIDGIERLALVTGAGDDVIHLYGLNEELALVLNLGSGDDILYVGGDTDTFEVTYPASAAIHSVEHDVVADIIDPDRPEERTLNQVEFVKRDLTLADKQRAFKEFYKKWVASNDTAITEKQWQLLEANFVLALKLFAQGVERATGSNPNAVLVNDNAGNSQQEIDDYVDRVNRLGSYYSANERVAMECLLRVAVASRWNGARPA